jgi:dTMP kinase
VSSDRAPFIPSPDPVGTPEPEPLRIFGTRAYFRLWIAQVVSSTGDWIGLVAILAIVDRVYEGSGAAISLVMLARVVPGFFLGTVGGVLIDRLDRRAVMVFCDLARAGLLVVLLFWESLLVLVLVSLALEMLTLMWGPAKDASVPHLVDPEHYSSANTLSLVASFATIPFASLIFSLLAALATWLGGFDALHSLRVDQEALALALDALTFAFSALLVLTLPIPRKLRGTGPRPRASDTVRDMSEGIAYVAREPRVRGVMVGLGLGLVGAGAMVPLGPSFAKGALGGDTTTFGVLLTALGFGAATGVLVLLFLQRRINRERAFDVAVIVTGAALVVAASFSSVLPAALAVAVVGGAAGTAYVSGFTVLQETVENEVRGRAFAMVYTLVRLGLFVSLVVSPLVAELGDWLMGTVLSTETATIGGVEYVLPGVRVALWFGGLVTLGGGLYARHSVVHARRSGAAAATAGEDAA